MELSGCWTEIELDKAILEDKLQIFSFVAARYFFSLTLRCNFTKDYEYQARPVLGSLLKAPFYSGIMLVW